MLVPFHPVIAHHHHCGHAELCGRVLRRLPISSESNYEQRRGRKVLTMSYIIQT